MKLYYSPGAASLAVRITIHEMKIPCMFEGVDLKSKQTEAGDNFFNITPKGAVPALKLPNQMILTETAIIQQYLADHFSGARLLPQAGDKRYNILEWLNFISTEIHKSFVPLLNQHVPAEIKETVFTPYLKAKLEIINSHLQNKKYLVDNDFSLADCYLFTVLFWLPYFLQLDLSQWENLTNYFSMHKNRKSIQQAFEEECLPLNV